MVLGDHAWGFEGPLIDFYFFVCAEHMDKTVKENTHSSSLHNLDGNLDLASAEFRKSL